VSSSVRRALAAAVLAGGAVHQLERRRPASAQEWRRTNFRGRSVSLVAGPALVVSAALTGPGVPGAVAVAGAGLAGAYDDLRGQSSDAKGFRGHLAALRAGRLTTGGVKLVGISGTSLLAAALIRPRRHLLLGGAVIAGSANLLNLLDVRPGRALKVGLAGGLALGQPGIVGGCAALLPADLDERRMLGDAGANALGAALGVALVKNVRSRVGRQAALAALLALTAASERISFTAVIDRSPVLRRLDQLGRRL
jgi:UDP-GlcNAc:undecaprenyl-phosphate GlcNAc-1-phosphate transferase